MPRLTVANLAEQRLYRQLLIPVVQEAQDRADYDLRLLARRTGLTRHYLTQIEQGKHRPVPEDLALIAYALTVTTDDDLHAARRFAAQLARIAAVIAEQVDPRGRARSAAGEPITAAVAAHLERIIAEPGRTRSRARCHRREQLRNPRTQKTREPTSASQPTCNPMSEPHPLPLRRPASELGHPHTTLRRTA